MSVKKIGNGQKKIDIPGSTNNYYYWSTKEEQSSANKRKAIDDQDAASIAKQFEEKTGGNFHNADDVISDLKRDGRLQSSYDRKRYTVRIKGKFQLEIVP